MLLTYGFYTNNGTGYKLIRKVFSWDPDLNKITAKLVHKYGDGLHFFEVDDIFMLPESI